MNKGKMDTTGLAAPSRMTRQLTGGNIQEGMFKPGALGANIGEDDFEQLEQPVSVCMIGTGEYTTGYVYGKASDSDKGAGGMVCNVVEACDCEVCILRRT